jgi:catechol 2,3-dioxygenase-like lactoylglutathione lyase family enzyme
MGLTATRPAILLDLLVLDTDDPAALADFYCRLLDWSVVRQEEGWISIGGAGDAPRLAFQLTVNHRPPTYPSPEVPQQAHLDLLVEDLDAAEAYALSVGATRLDTLGGRTFRVFADPSGHPFCLSL